MSELRARGALPRSVTILVGAAAVVILGAGIRSVSGIAGPALLAIVLAIAVSPLRTWLVRRGAPSWLGTLVAVVTIYVLLLVLGTALLVSVARFATIVPDYQDQMVDLVDEVSVRLSDVGVGDDQINAVVRSIDLGRVSALVGTLLASIANGVSSLIFIVTLVFFVGLDLGPFGRAVEALRGSRPAVVEAIEAFATGTRKYLVVSTIFGLVVAVIDIGLLYALGVPGALLWGLLAFITNYIPNVGFVIGLVPPAVLGVLEGGPWLGLWVVVGYTVVNTGIQSFIQPKIVGDAVGLSATVTFLSLVVWAFLLGPLGAILAVPLTLLVKAIFIDVDPESRWVNALLGGKSPPPGSSPDPSPEQGSGSGPAPGAAPGPAPGTAG